MRTRIPKTLNPFSMALIEESDLAYCLHIVFQNQHIEPGVLMGIRTRNDPIPEGERAFILASTKKALKEGDTPVKIMHFSEKKKSKDE